MLVQPLRIQPVVHNESLVSTICDRCFLALVIIGCRVVAVVAEMLCSSASNSSKTATSTVSVASGFSDTSTEPSSQDLDALSVSF